MAESTDASVMTSFTTPPGTSPPATPGETITVNNFYTITAGPNETTAATVITDELSANIPQADVVVGDGGSYNAGIITWNVGPETGGPDGGLAFGDDSASITIPLDYGQPDIVSISEISIPPGDVNIADNESTASIAVVCFCPGTSVLTPTGGVQVEDLSVGDYVVTATGANRPIRWLGHRSVDCRNHPYPNDVRPVRISAHAFGARRPARDLFVSPGHAICIDVLGEVLIPAIALVNGATVQQVEVDEVTYWHVELESHDIILAENMPAESYLDMGNRGFFQEADVVDLAAAGPDADPAQRTHADFCRPFHGGGPLVDVVKVQLQKRAELNGWSLDCKLDLHLVVDGRRLDPVVRDLTARFHVPSDAKDVWLVSPTARPCDTMASGDHRDLGLYIASLRIDDGFDMRDVAIDDPLLCIGFHEVEDGCRRWTSGRARLPAPLWANCKDDFYLRVELAGLPVPRWTVPAAEVVAAERPRLSIVA